MLLRNHDKSAAGLNPTHVRFVLFAFAVCLCAQDTVIRTTVPLILVPVTVTDRQGKTLDGLTESDFEVLDNGKPVKHSLETTNQPVAVVVAVQTSAIAGPVLAKVQKIGPMFEPLVAGQRGIAAIVTYSDKITVRQEFTHSGGDFTEHMRKIEPDGDSRTEAHMNDALIQAVQMFADRPTFRHVMVLIGESRDRGSHAKLEEAITKAQAANVTIYPVNYSVYKTSYTSRGDERFASSGRRVYDTDPGNLLMIFTEIARLATQNAGDALAKYTGGEKVSFTRLDGLERVIEKVGEDLHSQYLLSFQANTDSSKTYHAIAVNVKRSEVVIGARPGYWPE